MLQFDWLRGMLCHFSTKFQLINIKLSSDKNQLKLIIDIKTVNKDIEND